jgi:hypothetical protein
MEFFLSIMQLIFLIFYIAIDEFTLKFTNNDTHYNSDNNHHNKDRLSINFMEDKKGDNEDKNDKTLESKSNQDKYSTGLVANTSDDPVLSKINKGKYKASDIQKDDNNPPFSSDIEDKKGVSVPIIDNEQDYEEDGHFSVYSPSEYSVISTNSIHSNDSESLIQKKLALQELDSKLQQEAKDREIAERLQQDLNIEDEKNNNADILYNVEKVSSKLDKEIGKLQDFFPGDDVEASSSKTTEHSSKNKESEKKHTLNPDSDSDSLNHKKTKKKP